MAGSCREVGKSSNGEKERKLSKAVMEDSWEKRMGK